MNWMSIVLLSVLCVYVVMSLVDRFVVTPRRSYKTLPVLTAKVEELEKRLADLEGR